MSRPIGRQSPVFGKVDTDIKSSRNNRADGIDRRLEGIRAVAQARGTKMVDVTFFCILTVQDFIRMGQIQNVHVGYCDMRMNNNGCPWG